MHKPLIELLETRQLLADGFAAGVTGGAGGTVVTVTTAAQFNSYINQNGAYIIQVQGTIDLRPLDGANGRVFTKDNKTIRGIGAQPTVIGNLNITDAVSNVIVENLYWTNPGAGADGLTIWDGDNVFVNHVSFYDCGDGMCDVNNGSNDVTVSWCKFYYPSQTDHRFAMIADGTSTEKLRITLHHNWWAERCDQRMPASTNGQIHAYNNYFSCSGNFYAQNARNGTQILSENNYFDDGVNNPVGISAGTDGKIRTIGNIYDNTTGTIHPGTDTVFTPAYSYTLDPTANVPAIVMTGAGVQAPPTIASPAAATSVSWTGSDYFVNPTGANGAFTSIQAAINAVPAGTAAKRTRIFIEPGTYVETTGANGNLNITKPYVSLIGRGASPADVVIQNAVPGLTGATRLQSAATDFIASNLTFANTLGDNAGQAVALRGSADRAAFLNCRFVGFQDTLLVDNNSRQYFKDCYITGDTDFIFGNATAVFDRCTINSSDAGYITAAETSPNIANGLIFLDCTLTASGAQVNKPNTTYLGRPWHWDQGKVPSTLFIRTKMGPHIIAAGWHPWDTANNTNPDATTRYSEYGSMNLSGAALNTSGRVSWADAMTATHAENYTLARIFGSASFWTAATQPETTGVAYISQGASWDPAAALASLQFGRGTIVSLSASGADDRGEAGLTYTWSVSSKPLGAADPVFSANTSNAAKNTAASFFAPGNYTFVVTVADAAALMTSSSVSVSVQAQALTISGSTPWYAHRTPDGQTLQLGPGDGAVAPVYQIHRSLLPSVNFDSNAAHTLTLAGGAFQLDADVISIWPQTTLNLTDAAATTITSTKKLNNLAVSDAKLDVKDQKLIIAAGDIGSWNGSAYTGILGMLQRGYDGGAWTGDGIVTTMSDALPPNMRTTVAVSRAADTAYSGSTFGGIPVSAADVLVMYTISGDANLDGRVDADDYFRIDSNYNKPPATLEFSKGDFNYDGRIDGEDYFLIDSGFAAAAAVAGDYFDAAGFQLSLPRSTFPTVYRAASSSLSTFDQLTRRETSEPGPEFLYST